MDLAKILALVSQAEQLAGTDIGRAVLGLLKDKLGGQLTPEQKAQLEAHDAHLALIEAESRKQAGG